MNSAKISEERDYFPVWPTKWDVSRTKSPSALLQTSSFSFLFKSHVFTLLRCQVTQSGRIVSFVVVAKKARIHIEVSQIKNKIKNKMS